MMNSLTNQQFKWPGKPGVPLHPEKDGWHWLLQVNGQYPEVWEWASDPAEYGAWCESQGDGQPKEIAKWFHYLGPVLKPDEAVTALLREAQLKAALREMVYEATHLSPQEDDGSHWAKISKRTLDKARAALKDEPFP